MLGATLGPRRIAGVSAALVLSALAVALLVTLDVDAGRRPASEVMSETAPRVPTARQLRAIESGLSSRRLPKVRELFAIPAGVKLTPEFVRTVRTWKSVTVVPDTFVTRSATSGEVEAVLDTESVSTRWVLRLDLVEDRWLVAGTRELP
jgi:hypothetical protein